MGWWGVRGLTVYYYKSKKSGYLYRFCSWPGHYALTKIVIYLILQFVNKRVTCIFMAGILWIGHFRTVNVEDAC